MRLWTQPEIGASSTESAHLRELLEGIIPHRVVEPACAGKETRNCTRQRLWTWRCTGSDACRSLRSTTASSETLPAQGAVVANYPWDGTEDKGSHYAASPDDATFIHLAKTYARAHRKMHASKEFANGITNGAAWYPLWGGLQVRSCVDVTSLWKAASLCSSTRTRTRTRTPTLVAACYQPGACCG